jgi:hypothetical protein
MGGHRESQIHGNLSLAAASSETSDLVRVRVAVYRSTIEIDIVRCYRAMRQSIEETDDGT